MSVPEPEGATIDLRRAALRAEAVLISNQKRPAAGQWLAKDRTKKLNASLHDDGLYLSAQLMGR